MEKVLYSTTYQGMVIEVIETETERSLQSDRSIIHSRIRLDDPTLLIQPYQQKMAEALSFVENPQRVLHLGLGGGCLATHIHLHHPDLEQDVVECYKEMVTIAKRYFSFPQSERVHVVISDATDIEHLNLANYDLIFLDLCDSFGPIPTFQSVDYLQKLKKLLKPGGWIAANSWSSQEALTKDIKSWKEVFPTVEVSTEKSREAVIYASQSIRVLDTPSLQ